MLRTMRILTIVCLLASSAAAAQAFDAGLPAACPMTGPVMQAAVAHSCCAPDDCACEIRMPSHDAAAAFIPALSGPYAGIADSPEQAGRSLSAGGTGLQEQPASESPPPKDKLYELFSDPRI